MPAEFDQLVVVGASAGGIEALSTLVGTLPDDFRAPIVIAQHLHPGRESSLVDILARHTRLPVQTVTDRAALRPGVVYVTPANRHVEITDHELRLGTGDAGAPSPSVDRLLTSAAGAFGDRVVAVILTGSGSDGAAGARDVKLAGGTVVVQNPDTASFSSMPKATAAGAVDFVSELEGIGPLLARLVQGSDTSVDPGEDAALALFLDRVRAQSGIDFNDYKRPTILRRLHRRMAAAGSETLADYLRHVERHPDEYGRLVGDFLINVTEFYRDPALFDYLGGEVMPRLIDQALAGNHELRLWSAGCATGEEAYSLAILTAEAAGDRLDELDVRIFATDVDDDAITVARRGVYSEASVATLPPELRDRYLTSIDGKYEIGKAIRALTVFGQHDLAARAPFPRIDLILCRNVLIYFTPELQKRALHAFAFALRPGGRLVLGKSESVSALPEYFVSEQPRLRVFRREGAARLAVPPRIRFEPIPISSYRVHAGLEAANRLTNREIDRSHATGTRAAQVIQELPVGIVLVNRQYDIEDINVVARRLLNVHGTAFGRDFVHLAEVLPAGPLRAAIDRAARGESSVERFEITTADMAPDERRHLELVMQPFPGPGPSDEVLLAIRDATHEVESGLTLDRLTGQLERAADGTRRLLAANDEVTAANAVLKAANEEYLLSTEEAQADREEVETLNEELQASNEELETLNEELQAAVEELNTANDDLVSRGREVEAQAATLREERARVASILTSMGDAVLAVDRDGLGVFANPAYQRLFGDAPLVPDDEAGGRLASEEWPQHRAARGEAFQMAFTMVGPDGARHWYEAHAQPLEGEVGTWSGVVVIRDISDRSVRHLQERFMAAASHELRTPIAALHGYLQLADRRLRDGVADEGSRYVTEALAQTRALGELAGRLFDVAQIERGALSLDRRPIDLVPLVHRWVEVAQVLHESATIRLAASPRRLTVDADVRRIEQVLFNLVTNAAVHATSGDRIEVRLSRDGGEARLEVEDFGPGIAHDDLPTVFSRFGALYARDGASRGGLGLGLYLAREIVLAHGGTIDIESTLGKGTTVTVRLPLTAGRRPRKPPEQ